jgi:hypothetical protein
VTKIATRKLGKTSLLVPYERHNNVKLKSYFGWLEFIVIQMIKAAVHMIFAETQSKNVKECATASSEVCGNIHEEEKELIR